MYAALSNQRLLSLVDAKYHDLVRDRWRGDEGYFALESMMELAGVQKTHVGPITTSEVRFQVIDSCEVGTQVRPHSVHHDAIL
jgi:hypothetical protein